MCVCVSFMGTCITYSVHCTGVCVCVYVNNAGTYIHMCACECMYAGEIHYPHPVCKKEMPTVKVF